MGYQLNTSVPSRLQGGKNSTAEKLLVAASELMIERASIEVSLSDIAQKSGVNAALVKYHFGNKDGLFDRVVEDRIEQLLDAVPFDAVDLPGYAVRLWEFNVAHPSLVRLLLWHALVIRREHQRAGQTPLARRTPDSANRTYPSAPRP